MPRLDWLVTSLRIVGGAESYVRRLAPRLLRAGWEVRVITLVDGGRILDDLRSEGVPTVELGLNHQAGFGPAFGRLLRLWRANLPDLVHTHLYHAGLVGRVAARWLGIPVVVHQHGVEYARSRLRTLLDGKTRSWVNRYAASCRAVADILAARERIPRSQIAVIYNGLEVSAFDRSPPTQRPIAWPVPANSLTVGCVGRLAPEKGQSTLIQAASSLVARGRDFHLVLLGDGNLLARLQEQCKRLGLEKKVHFAGQQEDVAVWLSYFDLFTLPSKWEGISMALLEAMASGLPVVATNVGGTPEVVRDGQTGFLTLPGDPQALAFAIERLLSDPDLRRRMGAAGRWRVKQHFTIERTLQQLEKLYHELLEQGVSQA